jgi:hypothetical protein
MGFRSFGPPGLSEICLFRSTVLLAALCFALFSTVAYPATPPTPFNIPSHHTQAGFESISPSESGIAFSNALPPMDAARNQILLNGSGVAAGDVDGDGWVDLFVASLRDGNRLYRNLGNLRFSDVTPASGTLLPSQPSTGVAFADVDGDGSLDLLVNTLGGTHLFRNDGSGRFSPVPDAGLLRRFGATSLALADIDRDGDLDLYVTNYRTNTIRSSGFSVLNVNGRRMVRPEDRDRLEYLPDGRILEHGEPDQLYLNDGRGRFSPVPWTAGHFLDEAGQPLARPPFDWSLSAAFRDLNADGWPDLYVCGDFHSPDRLWLNDTTGRFRAAPSSTLRNTPTFSMAVDFADLDRDGHDDFMVADMLDPRHEFRIVQSTGAMSIPGDFESRLNRPQLTRNTLQLNRGDGTFAEAAYFAGLEATGWTWNLAFLDVDLDGYEDLLAATGHLFDTQDQDAQEHIDAAGPYRPDQIPGKLLRYPPLLSRMLAFQNRGDRRFRESTTDWGWGTEPGVWQGLCLADLDNDGDLDVVVNRLNGPVTVFRNLATAPRVAVRLKGRAPNTRGIGARIELHGGPVPVQSQEMSAGGRYLSSDDPMRVFAARTTNGPLRLEVRWPSGRRSVITQVQPNHLYQVDENETEPIPSPSSRKPEPTQPPLFADESTRLGHRHFESPFDDFQRQPLLPRRHSQSGPGVGWIDLNGDGREDLFVASGKGGRPGIFFTGGNGSFSLVEPNPAAHDQIGVAGWVSESGTPAALVASTAYEDGRGAAILAYDRTGASNEVLPLGADSLGPLALADIDGDGDLDLFVGGRAVGGRFPEASPSRLFERHDGRWQPSVTNTLTLASAGSVQGALWTDLNQDGFPELVLACDWGTVRLYHNHRGRLRDTTPDRVLESGTGNWSGVHAGDFNGDGRLDLVVGNWGLNSHYRATPQIPFRLYFGDLAGQGQVDLIEASHEPALGRWMPDRDLTSMARQFPWLREKFPGHRIYGRATVEDLLTHVANPAQLIAITELRSMVFLNRGDRFEPLPLPDEAQLAPVFGVDVADFDLDGHLDLFLAQNLFAVSTAVSRQDAGRGLLLRGDGTGHFHPVPSTRSGITIDGEQRGSACHDYDADGRPDLVVTQNRDETRLFRNTSPNPGLQVRLRGPRHNPHAIGASVRIRDGSNRPGPLQEIHAGNGYGSHSSPVLCFPRPTQDVVLEVRWPGGSTLSHPLAADARRATVLLDIQPTQAP